MFSASTMDRSLRNVLVVSFGFLLLFTAYGGLQSLQSSLYSEEGLGVTALSTLYGGMLLSSMFLPPLLIERLGCKGTIILSMCGYVAFSVGNFFASWYTLIPTSILLGLGAAPLWSAQSTYLTIMGNTHAKKAGKHGKDVVNQYFGIFFLVFQSSGVWGNLISSLVFGQTPSQEALPEEQLMSCGASDCLMATATTNSTQRPSQQLVYTLLGIYTGSGVLAVLMIAAFLKPIGDVQRESEGEKKSPPFWSTLLSTFKLYRDKRLCLLILLPLYSGLQQGFLSSEYTRSYVTCALGIQFVGYVMICFSATNALCSVLYGKVSQYTGRAVLYVLGTVTHLSCMIALLLWRPGADQLAVFFVFSGLWGVADAVWQTQNNDFGTRVSECQVLHVTCEALRARKVYIYGKTQRAEENTATYEEAELALNQPELDEGRRWGSGVSPFLGGQRFLIMAAQYKFHLEMLE
uniref:Protein unc-93 homolog A n=1 Tax=Macaca mulatta TaxID=9544 RepID=F7ASJ9_MACMU